ncbi:TRAP transporter permease [Lacrimispora sp.]|uniref:TRAP transporter permease n=1 Tax=Lacrimispora sp. TaxID=2719234 RepID=UPI003460DA5D
MTNKIPLNVLTDIQTDGQLNEEQQALLESIDKESATRTLGSSMGKLLYILAVLVSLYHLYTAAFGPPLTLKHRSLHVAMMLALTFIMYPFSGKSKSKKTIAWYDWGLAALSLTAPIYIWTQFTGVVERAGNPNQMDLIMATLLVILVLEAARRCGGWALPVLSLIFISYGLWGRNLPGMFTHRGYTWEVLSNHFFANTEGIYGTSVSVASSYIFLFILFGSVMQKSGMGKFFNDISLALAGHTKGGPAKVSVIASGLLGSINGSAVANVVTTGAFTIPLMKKTGYSAEFAGAVESSASVGGQLLPPVMGAAAFIMAEMLGVKYSEIIVCATVPALLYYIGILVQVQLRASKNGLVGLPKDRLPEVKEIMKERGHLLIPIVFLLYMLFFSGTTVIYSAFFTIIVTILVSMLRKSTRMSAKDIIDSLAEGAKATVSVAIACACVGMIIGVSSKTGFGLNMANAIIALGGKSLFATLVFSMVTCMILGMGLPSIPAYIITAAIAAPALAQLGIPEIAAHMFSFYFAMFANITPPVALAAFAASGISGGNAVKTGLQSVKLSIAGFIVPYMFVYSPELLLIDTTFAEGLWVAIAACIGVFMIGAAAEGYFLTKINPILRIALFIGALLLINSSLVTDMIGFIILIGVLMVQKVVSQRMAMAGDLLES